MFSYVRLSYCGFPAVITMLVHSVLEGNWLEISVIIPIKYSYAAEVKSGSNWSFLFDFSKTTFLFRIADRQEDKMCWWRLQRRER